MAKMVRTTIMAGSGQLEQLRLIAKNEGVSLGEVIRQGLELRIRSQRRIPSFIGAVSSSEPFDARDEEEILLEYASARDARRRDARL